MIEGKRNNNFGDLEAFGFGGIPLVNNFRTHKITEHFNGGCKLNYIHVDDDTDTAIIQGSLL